MLDPVNLINPGLITFNSLQINGEDRLPLYIFNFENTDILEHTIRLIYLSQIKGKNEKVIRCFEGLVKGVFNISCDQITDDIPYQFGKEEAQNLADHDTFYTSLPDKVEHAYKSLQIEPQQVPLGDGDMRIVDEGEANKNTLFYGSDKFQPVLRFLYTIYE